MKHFISIVTLAFWAGATQAATVSESVVGEFSSDALNPTIIAAGTDGITGTGNGSAFDTFQIDGLPTGAQDITFSFYAPDGIGFSYSAGGSLLYSTSPFTGPWSGDTVGSFGATHNSPTDDLTLSLDSGFSGTLFLAFNFTHGSDLNYNFNFPTTGALAAQIPVPAAGLLLFSGLLGVGALRRRRA